MAEVSVLSRIPVGRVLSALLSRGGEYAELFSEETRSLTIQLDDSRVERVVSGEDAGIGLRLLFRGKTYYAYANDRDARALLSLAGDLSRYAGGEGISADGVGFSGVRRDDLSAPPRPRSASRRSTWSPGSKP